jgi:hypothetical protein
LLADRRREHPVRAVALRGRQTVVADVLNVGIVGAERRFAGLSIEPAVEDHAVPIGQVAGADGGMSRARHGVQIRIGGIREPRAVAQQAVKAGTEVRSVHREVIRAKLIDDDDDDEFGLAAPPGLR